MAVSVLALLVTFTGIAGALPGKNRVNSGDVRNNSLTGKDIKESTLKLPAAAVTSGLKISVYSRAVGTLAYSNTGGATATCPAGKQAIAGGGLSDQSSIYGVMTDSRPSQGPAGSAPGALVKEGESFVAWRTYWRNEGVATLGPVTYVVCVG